jgi:hypothetical protein
MAKARFLKNTVKRLGGGAKYTVFDREKSIQFQIVANVSKVSPKMFIRQFGNTNITSAINVAVAIDGKQQTLAGGNRYIIDYQGSYYTITDTPQTVDMGFVKYNAIYQTQND